MVALAVPVQATPLQGAVTAGSLGAAGPTSLQASLVAFVQPDKLRGDRIDSSTLAVESDGTQPDPRFSLSAKSLRLVSHSADPKVHYLDVNGEPESFEQTYENASVDGLENRPSYSWSLFPLGTGTTALEAESTCSALRPSQEATVRRTSHVGFSGPDNAVESPVSDALVWAACSGSARMTARGDFLLMLWEWDVVLRADGRDHVLPSGRTRWDHDPDDPTGTIESRNVVSKDWQRYLYVQEGTLTLQVPAPGKGAYGLYVGPDARLEAPQLQLNGVTGRITVGGRAVDLHTNALLWGNLAMTAGGTGLGLPIIANLQGDLQGASIDGASIATNAQAADPVFPEARLLGIAAGALLVGVFATRARLPAATLAVACSRSAYALGWNRSSRTWAALATRLAPALPAARLVRAKALTALVRYEQALEDHATLDRMLPRSQRARNAVEAARTLTAMGRRRAALTWLSRALECDPDVLYPAMDDADFQDLWAEPWFLLQRQNHAYRNGGFPEGPHSLRRAGNAQSLRLGGEPSASLP